MPLLVLRPVLLRGRQLGLQGLPGSLQLRQLLQDGVVPLLVLRPVLVRGRQLGL